ncbi:MAG: DUF3160 domain-containing protein, partial [Prevotella sp.]|nr:DUF3160 domain-containing protein [Prevotella sp.]
MKNLFVTVLALLMSITSQAQQPGKHVYIPGNGHLDVEQFIKPIDTRMDISRLSLAELRILRNAFAARQGFVLKDADLRHIFSQTSWYDSIVWEKYDMPQDQYLNSPDNDWEFFSGYSEYSQSVKLTAAERAFIRRIQNREQSLQWSGDKTLPAGWRFRTDNILNPFQLEKMDSRLEEALGRNSFAIVPGRKIQLFHVYEKNDYSDFPSFVTTDLYLQLFHMYFDCMVREMEQHGLSKAVEEFSHAMYENTTGWNQAYFAIAEALITGKNPQAVESKYTQMVADEMGKIANSQDGFSEFLDYRDVKFGYSLFRPRGHYTRNDTLGRYFRAMMWLQHVPFGTDKPQQLQNALILADEIGKNDALRNTYARLFEPMTFLFGQPDNLTILQVYDEMKKIGLPLDKLLKNKKALDVLQQNLDEMGEKQTRIRPKFERTSHVKINLMPQRYMPDAEVMNEMIDAVNDPTKRAVPSGLDVFAAMNAGIAEKVLTGELKVQEAWPEFLPMLQKMKARMQEIDWQETLATRWMSALQTLQDTTYFYRFDTYNESENQLPAFMRTDQWAKKNLNTALASWAELKHDAILYAKQPVGAECGAGGPPDPVLKGYVEPNVNFWKRAVALNIALDEFMEKYQLKTNKLLATGNRISELAEFLLRVSRKETGWGGLTDEEYKQIEIIGSTVENISLDIIREPDQYLDGWDNVQGADRSIACVADVYTANADNNPNKSILYAATGPAYEIYVAVDINGERYLTRGAVLSYREFQRPLGEQRLTDEEWQEQLKGSPDRGVPSWMKEIIVPLDGELQDNEELFYSSG